MEDLRLHLQHLYLALEDPPDMINNLLRSDYFCGNHADILQLQGIFRCLEDPYIFAKWCSNSKVITYFTFFFKKNTRVVK